MSGILPGHLDAPLLRTPGTGFPYVPEGDDDGSWRLLAAAQTEAFRHKLAMLNIETQRRIALHPSHRKADQAHTPAGTKAQGERPATLGPAPDGKAMPPDSQVADAGAAKSTDPLTAS